MVRGNCNIYASLYTILTGLVILMALAQKNIGTMGNLPLQPEEYFKFRNVDKPKKGCSCSCYDPGVDHNACSVCHENHKDDEPPVFDPEGWFNKGQEHLKTDHAFTTHLINKDWHDAKLFDKQKCLDNLEPI